MRSYEIFPLFPRAPGFDRMAQMMNAAMLDTGDSAASAACDIRRTGENSYQITLAVPGFSEADLEVVQQESALVISGKRAEEENEAENGGWLHRGIADRAFESRFQLADHIRVENAALKNGLLSLDLTRDVPEEKQPRRITVNTAAIEQKAA